MQIVSAPAPSVSDYAHEKLDSTAESCKIQSFLMEWGRGGGQSRRLPLLTCNCWEMLQLSAYSYSYRINGRYKLFCKNRLYWRVNINCFAKIVYIQEKI